MKASCRLGRVPKVFGAVAVGAIVAFASFQMAGAQDVSAKKGEILTAGPGIPKSKDFIVLPPITVDYRDDETTRSLEAGELIANGKPRMISHAGSVAATGEFCRFNLECNDCDACTLDVCGDSVCTGGARNGAACTSDSDCEGACTGGSNPGMLCRNDLDCCGDGGAIANGTCTFNPCTPLTTGGAGGTGGPQCINWALPDGRFEAGSECDDGLDCNGHETCTAGSCTAGDPLTTLAPRCDGGVRVGLVCDPGGDMAIECPVIGGPPHANCVPTPVACGDQELVCAESSNSCITACKEDADCDIDGKACTPDICANPKTCVGGANDGAPCATNAECASGVCDGGGDGLCSLGANPCGPGGTCSEPAVPGGNPVCGTGRCCDGGFECTAQTYADCNTAGGSWLHTDSACELLDSNNIDACPVYGSGMAPQGDYTVLVNNVTSFAPCPGTLTGIGDDFQIVGAAPGDYIDVRLVRMVVQVQTAARFAIEFWDKDGIFIEDAFFPLGVNLGAGTAPVVLTADFDPPLTVPADAFLAISIATNFGPFGNVAWMATNGVDVGTNDPNVLLINGVPTTSNFLGQCSGGPRDGSWCDIGNGDGDCNGGTCVDVPDTLAFEVVATPGGAPEGACCISESGVCARELPWVCEAGGNFFQGVGTYCRACLNNLFTACLGDGDCPACVGGANDGDSCETDADCGGGTCTGTSTCVDTPPACQFNACCLGDGNCVPVQGGVCAVTLGGCLSDADCTGGADTCEPDCGAGTAQGFGTTCEPNCCDQPTLSGGDSCLDAPVTAITVPIIGDPPVTKTLTGSNVGATYDDWNDTICVGGANDGLPCDFNDPNSCGVDGTCTRVCGSGIFDPSGATADPAWWEAFSINACANVRVDMCCTDPVLQPQWAFLSAGCPCQIFIGNTGIAPPVGVGEGTAGSARGTPFCNEDNLWQTYATLGAGTYYVPVYSAPNGSFASPPGGTYQMHITVGACAEAACCTNLCSGGTRDGQACNPAGVPACPGPGSECVGGFCAGGAFDGLPCDGLTGVVDQCPGGACGGPGCTETNELICGAAGGSWLAGEDYPDYVCVGGSSAGAACDIALGNSGCPGGTCNENPPIVDCGGAPCATGACCLGPGACLDQIPNNGGPMDKATCDIQEGDFVGGSRCLFDPSPCPVCTALSPDNCQRDNAGFISWADRTLTYDYGRKLADDFVARSTAIEQFCWWPAFLQVNEATGGTNECSDPNDTPPPPPDNWEIRFFEDTNGLPGNLLHEVILLEGDVTAKSWRGGNSRVWSYSQVFDPPLSGFQIGDRYWVEFSGSGNDTCNVLILQSEDGNGYFLQESNQFGDDVWTIGDVSTSQNDIAFCIGGPATPSIDFAPPLTGACCRCDGTCTDDVSRDDCMGYTCLRDGTDAGADCQPLCTPEDQAVACTVLPADGYLTATFSAGQTCAQAGCENLGAGGGCPGDPGGREGEDCVFPLVLPGDGDYPFNNNCSSTDGPAPFGPTAEIQADNGATGTFERDLWYTYTTSTTGVFQVDLCGDGNFDTMLAVYSNGTSACPAVCPPPKAELLGDVYIDDACSLTLGKPSFEKFSNPDVCYLIRVGGFRDASTTDNPDIDELNVAGNGVMTVQTKGTNCLTAEPAVQQMVLGNSGSDVVSVKNRALSISVPGSAGRSQAIRVTFVDLPAPYDVWNGEVLWVNNEPSLVSENGGSIVHVAGFPDYYVATLDCDRASSLADWSTFGTIHIVHEGIIPGGRYEVVVTDNTCVVGEDGEFSTAVEFLSPRWGDLVGGFNVGAQAWTAPNASVDVAADVVSVLDKFGSAATAPIKARCDLEPRALDFKINITDVTVILDAFGGGSYPFAPSVGDPCP